MRKILTRASGPGGGNSILRSIRPGRRRAESKISTVFMSVSEISAREYFSTYSVCRHDNLDVLRRLKTIQLVQQL